MNNHSLLAPISWFGTGLTMTLRAPYMLYRAFAGELHFHWLIWLALYYCIASAWECAFAVYRQGLGIEAMYILILSGLVFAILQGITKILMKASGPLSFLAWVPGQGMLRSWIAYKAPAMPAGMGGANPGDKLLRGTAIVPAAVQAAVVAARHTKKELADAFKWDVVPIPPKLEAEHFLIEGKTGSGKTVAISALLRKARSRDQAAIIADNGGNFYSLFGRESDFLLNPFDRRTVDWSPFAEIRAEYDYRRIAKAAIPDAEGEHGKWTSDAQLLFSECLRLLHQRGEPSIKRLLYYVTIAPREELADFFGNESPAANLVGPGQDRLFGSVRTSASTPLSNWVFLADHGTFSIRQWVREAADETKSWLFMTYKEDQMAELRSLIACWLDLAIVEGLSMKESRTRRLWYIMDEVDSLGKITSLRAGLTKLRRFGGACVAGLQTISQLRSTYGKDEAQTLLSCLSTKMILKSGDGETAKHFEVEIGQQEVEREEVSEGTSQRTGDMSSSSENKSVRRITQSAVLASEIMGIDNLYGYLMVTGCPVGRIRLQPVDMPVLNVAVELKDEVSA